MHEGKNYVDYQLGVDKGKLTAVANRISRSCERRNKFVSGPC